MELITRIRNEAKKALKPIVLPEGLEDRVIRAARILASDKIVQPILLGDEKKIRQKSEELKIDLSDISIFNPVSHPDLKKFANKYFELRKHKGVTPEAAKEAILNPLFFGAMMVRENIATGAVAGSINTTGDVLKAAIQIVGLMQNIKVVSSSFLMVLKNGEILTFADCAVIPDPDPEQLASIAISSAQTHQKLVGTEPSVAMLSFSTKGSAKHPLADKVVEALQIVKKIEPSLNIDGELQFDAAYIPEIGNRKAPGSPVAGKANVFI
ncbi:MAG: phosphate acyltransferase, partial [Calditrichia bacterium]